MTIITENGIDVLVDVDNSIEYETLKGLSDEDIDSFVYGINDCFSDSRVRDDTLLAEVKMEVSDKGIAYGGNLFIMIRTFKGSNLDRFISKFGIRRLWQYIEAEIYVTYLNMGMDDDTERYLLKKIS